MESVGMIDPKMARNLKAFGPKYLEAGLMMR
jgi:hypothetical protein